MEISKEDLAVLIHHARKGATDIANQIIDEIVERVQS